jgi:hypothetical protein
MLSKLKMKKVQLEQAAIRFYSTISESTTATSQTHNAIVDFRQGLHKPQLRALRSAN